MRGIATIVFTGVAMVLIYDTVAAFVSLSTGISYGLFSIGSLLLYVIFGFLAAIRSKWFFGATSGAVLGLVDSTLGWGISWNIGPGKPAMEINAVLIAITIIFVIVAAAVLGLVGGALSLLKKQNA